MTALAAGVGASALSLALLAASVGGGLGDSVERAGSTALRDAAGLRTVVLAAAADAYLRDGGPNQNQGGESVLRIRSSGRNRALVRFDNDDVAAALAGNVLVSAHLELRVQASGSTGASPEAVSLPSAGAEGGACLLAEVDQERPVLVPKTAATNT